MKIYFALKVPRVLISSLSCIIEGFISILSSSKIIFEISVGFTDPYNSLFSVLSFLIMLNCLFFNFSKISLAFFFFLDFFC